MIFTAINQVNTNGRTGAVLAGWEEGSPLPTHTSETFRHHGLLIDDLSHDYRVVIKQV